MILITTVLCCTNSLSRTSFDFSLKTSFVYSNLFSLAKPWERPWERWVLSFPSAEDWEALSQVSLQAMEETMAAQDK